ncbi:MAG TPA: hypothetical protein V6D14_21015 [Coleofasciculaceae cyanobacterium]|jgi:hypothetical protein
MTSLFRRLQPRQKFRITLTCIAQLLKIPKHLIVRIECWAYVLFVHRTDKGGQFISYRQLRQWLYASACQIQNCSTLQQLHFLWMAIEEDYKKHKKQYNDEYLPFLCKIWTKRAQTIDSLYQQPEFIYGDIEIAI